jgi:hypothetical protein
MIIPRNLEISGIATLQKAESENGGARNFSGGAVLAAQKGTATQRQTMWYQGVSSTEAGHGHGSGVFYIGRIDSVHVSNGHGTIVQELNNFMGVLYY